MYVTGLISGTSVDGIDAALVELSGGTEDLQINLLAGQTFPYPEDLRQKILAVCGGAALSMHELADLDDAIATQFAHAALAIQEGHPPAALIGSHGQTVFHRPPRRDGGDGGDYRSSSRPSQSSPPVSPDSRLPTPDSRPGYSLQLGRGDLIAAQTGILSVSNFRVADIAAGGQGAPLVSKLDACLLGRPDQSCCVQNIGGIGNVTYLPACKDETWEESIMGWDTGPGNSLLDLAVNQLSGGTLTYDHNGQWAATGQPCQVLVDQWLQQDFFHQPPPKSTGRELFGVDYLHQCLADCQQYNLTPADILATLTELTAASIAHSYQTSLPRMPDRVLLCGGGSKNQALKQRLQSLLTPIPVHTTDEVGLSADFKEAIAFAVLAYWRIHNIPGNLPAVTGAQQAVLLGNIHPVMGFSNPLSC
jgi:anhydro-N-acetylmuramic acid kinase